MEIQKGAPRPADDVYRIMILAEQKDFLDQLSESCKALGQEVVTVSTIASAMKFLNTQDHVDVVVSEAFLQNESSFDFLIQLKKKADHKEVPVMLVAWNPGDVAKFCAESVSQTAKVLGAYKFLIMPEFDLAQLAREVDSILPKQKIPKKEEHPAGAH